MTRYLVDVTGVRLARGKTGTGVSRVERELSARAHLHLDGKGRFIYFNPSLDSFVDIGSTAYPLDDKRLELAGTVLSFQPGDRLISFGLECNNKNYRSLVKQARAGLFELHSVLHDLIGPLNPQLAVPGYGEYLRGFFSDMCWGVSRFHANSEHSRRQLVKLSKEENIPLPPISVFRLGSDIKPSSTDPKNETEQTWISQSKIGPRRFVLYVSTVEARKNHYVVYRAWARAVASGRIDPKRFALVFAGQKGWGVDDLIEQIKCDPSSSSSIVLLDELDDKKITDLYENCEFTVFPSLDEGYGLPVAESLSLGRACLSSNAGALPEIVGEIVNMIDPLDVPSWEREICHWLESPDLVKAAEAKIKNDYRFVSWDDSAAQFFASVKV